MSQYEVHNATDNQTYVDVKESHEKSVLYYSLLITSSTVLTLAQSFVLFYFTTKASIQLHKTTFSKVIVAPMDFFDLHLSGNVLNRFSKDIGLIDEMLPFIMFEVLRVTSTVPFVNLTFFSGKIFSYLQCTFILGGVVLVISLVQPVFIGVALGFGLVLYILKVFYQPTSRSIKRLENASKVLF